MPTRPVMPDVVDIYRPFGAAMPSQTGVLCRLVPNLRSGRGAIGTTDYLQWTHWIDVDKSVDIRDGCSRAAGTTINSYSDGDGVQFVKDGIICKFVVVWVELRYTNTPFEYKRAYLHRDVAIFASPVSCPACAPGGTPTVITGTLAGFGGAGFAGAGSQANAGPFSAPQQALPCQWQVHTGNVLVNVTRAGGNFQVFLYLDGDPSAYAYFYNGPAPNCLGPNVIPLSVAAPGYTGPPSLTITGVP